MTALMATITGEGQVVIPAKVREHLGIGHGDEILFVLGEEGVVELRAISYPRVASLRGAAGKLAQALSWEEMRQIAREDSLEGDLSK